MSKSFSEITSKLNIPIRYNSPRQTVQFDDIIKKDLGYSEGVRGSRARKKMHHFRKMVHSN